MVYVPSFFYIYFICRAWHELPARPASCFSFGDGTHTCLVCFAWLRGGRWECPRWHHAQRLSCSHWLKACSAFHESLSCALSRSASIAFGGTCHVRNS